MDRSRTSAAARPPSVGRQCGARVPAAAMVSHLGVAPVRLAHVEVHYLCQCLGKPVGDRLGHDLLVVVVVRLILGDQRVKPEAGRDRKHAQVVGDATRLGRDEVGHRKVAVHRQRHSRPNGRSPAGAVPSIRTHCIERCVDQRLVAAVAQRRRGEGFSGRRCAGWSCSQPGRARSPTEPIVLWMAADACRLPGGMHCR